MVFFNVKEAPHLELCCEAPAHSKSGQVPQARKNGSYGSHILPRSKTGILIKYILLGQNDENKGPNRSEIIIDLQINIIHSQIKSIQTSVTLSKSFRSVKESVARLHLASGLGGVRCPHICKTLRRDVLAETSQHCEF